MEYLDFRIIKSLHIIFVVSWFAALFYIVRLFIYHTEAQEKEEPERSILQKQFMVMEDRLWKIIGWPAAILATVFGLTMVEMMNLWSVSWMQLKLVMTGLLWAYHLYNHMLFKRFQRNEVTWSSTRLRFWNELATLWLVAIVFVVILKNSFDWIYGTVGFFLVAIMLFLGIRIYKGLRK